VDEDQDARFRHAYDDLMAELNGLARLRKDPEASFAALRMVKVRLNEVESVLREVHG
jgi:hypothetical protein